MPIYEYRCQDCDHEFERMQKFSDPPVEECPSCDGVVQKLISRSTFHLKGDGWYVTDYAKTGANGKKTSDDSDSSSDSSSKSETSSESKSSSKSDSTSSKSDSTSSKSDSTSSKSDSSSSSSTTSTSANSS